MGLSAPTMKIPPAAVITSPTAKVTTTAATNLIDLSAILEYDQNDDTRDNAVECRSFVHAGELVVGYDNGSR